MKKLRGGYTTGACAAAGVKAALLFMRDNFVPDSVELTALDGTRLIIPVRSVVEENDVVTATVQ